MIPRETRNPEAKGEAMTNPDTLKRTCPKCYARGRCDLAPDVPGVILQCRECGHRWQGREHSPNRPSLLRRVRLSDGRLAWPVASANGISEATFRSRLKAGVSPDVAATLPPSRAAAARKASAAARAARLDRPWLSGRPAKLARLCLPDGRPALAAAADAGISPVTLRQRLHRGWPVERAATEPAQKRSEAEPGGSVLEP